MKLTAPLKRNNLEFFVKRKTTQATTSNNLKKDISLFSRLFIACQVRKGDLPAFFSHENSAYPPSLSKEGKLRGGHKAYLLKCLEAYPEPTLSNVLLGRVEDVESDTELLLLDANLDEVISEIPVLEDASLVEVIADQPTFYQHEPSQLDSKIIEGAFLVQLLTPSTCRTFKEYAKQVFIPSVLAELRGVSRIDRVGMFICSTL